LWLVRVRPERGDGRLYVVAGLMLVSIVIPATVRRRRTENAGSKDPAYFFGASDRR
jgi:hypothetical protein